MDLSEYISQRGQPLPLAESVRLWREAARAVRNLADRGKFHSWLRARSFEIDPGLGAASLRIVDTANVFEGTSDHRAVHSGVWHLAAPEQTGLVEGECGPVTNIYNLGALGYLLVTGRVPHENLTGSDLAEAIVSRPLRRIEGCGLDEQTAELLHRVLSRATAKRPHERHVSIAHLESELSLLLPATPTGPGPLDLPLVGRKDALGRVAALLDSARGGDGVKLFLSGEAGIGKSYLWQTVEATQRRAGERWVYFKAPQTGTTPYAGFAVLLDQLLGSDFEIEQRALLRRLSEQGVSDRGRHMAATILPRFPTAIGLTVSDQGSHFDLRREGMESELASLVRALARPDRLTVVAVDDLQWIDNQTVQILHRLLENSHPRIAIVLLGRPEARARIPEELPVEELPLLGLSERETLSLLERMLLPTSSGSDIALLNGKIQKRAQGNPLATVNLLQLFRRRQTEPKGALLDSPLFIDTSGTESNLPEIEMLEVLARNRLEEVSADCRFLLRYLSLLLPPVSLEMVKRISSFDEQTLSDLLTESEQALLLNVDHTRRLAWFSHDSIESIARQEAFADPILVERASRTLFDASQEGSERASFALARLLVRSESNSEGYDQPPLFVSGLEKYLSGGDAVQILHWAAARALDLVIPSEASSFAAAALELIELNHGSMGETNGIRFSLHTIAHEAAFLQDDVYAMSRHFRHIRSLGGPLDVNEARQKWIARSYSKSKFSSAIRIGWIVFRELGAVRRGADLAEIESEARRFLRKSSPRRVLRRLLRVPATRDRRTVLIILTCIRIMLPVLTVERRQLSVLVHLIIKEGLANGTTGYSGMAFVCWGLFDGANSEAEMGDKRILEYALQMASRTTDAVARHTIRTYAGILNGISRARYQHALGQLPDLYQEGVRLANFEFAAHAIHIHAQGLLYTGRPLSEVFDIMGDYRTKLFAMNCDRTAITLEKFQQAVECLMGRTRDMLELTGSICSEREYREGIEKDADAMSIAGFHILKMFLATYNDEPSTALEYARRFGGQREVAAGLYDKFVAHFFWGMAAFRSGAISEGKRALKRFRFWVRVIPENHDHRYRALRAEQAAASGRMKAAVRDFTKATRLALERGYPSEAALFAERQGDLLRVDPSTTSLAYEPLHLAQSLYSQWGALPVAERVRGKLNWRETATIFDPVLSDESFLARITAAPSSQVFLDTVMNQVCRYTAATSAYLRAEISGHDVLSVQRVDGDAADTAGALRSSADVAELLGSLETAPIGTRSVDRFRMPSGEDRALLTCRIDPSLSISLRACLVGAPGSPPFSSFVRARVASAMLMSASILELREVARTEARQAEDLYSTRQELARTQEYSRVLFNTLPEALLLVDANLNVLFFSRSAERFVVRGSFPQPQLEPEARPIVLRAVRESDHRTPVVEVEAPWRNRILSAVATEPRLDSSSRRPGIFAVTIKDITEIKRQLESLRRKEQQLIVSDRMATIGMFSSAIAHEVSNPNHILKLNAQALMMFFQKWRDTGGSIDPADIEGAEGLVEKITDGARRIEGVVDQVKQYGREGRDEEWEVVDPGDICARALRFSRIMASQYTNHLLFEPCGDGPPIVAVRGQMEQAIVNLIKNACEALDSADGRVSVKTAYDARGDEVCISVSDTGPGIDPSVVDLLGQPFLTTRADEGGTGLGLSIVRTIVDRHGGRLSFRSNHEYNTIVEVRVPTADRAGT